RRNCQSVERARLDLLADAFVLTTIKQNVPISSQLGGNPITGRRGYFNINYRSNVSQQIGAAFENPAFCPLDVHLHEIRCSPNFEKCIESDSCNGLLRSHTSHP